MGLNLDKVLFDTTTPNESSNVGAYLRGPDGLLITKTTVGAKEALDVYVSGMAGQFAEDSAHVDTALGNFILAVRRDADTSMVDADGDYAPLQVDENGRLKVVADIEVANGFEKAEDSAHVSGDIGAYMLGVIQGTLSASAADGDYGSIKTDLLGRTYVNEAAQSGAYNTQTINATATDIIASDLANRTKVLIQNISNKKIYLGTNASVTVANGIELNPGSSIELAAGPSVNLHAIASSGTAEVRYLELA